MQKAEAQTLTIQGVPVYVEPDEDTTQNDVDTFLKYLKETAGIFNEKLYWNLFAGR